MLGALAISPLLMPLALTLLYYKYLCQFACQEFVFCIGEGEKEGNEAKLYTKILD
jgi:hypothetical protein